MCTMDNKQNKDNAAVIAFMAVAIVALFLFVIATIGIWAKNNDEGFTPYSKLQTQGQMKREYERCKATVPSDDYDCTAVFLMVSKNYIGVQYE